MTPGDVEAVSATGVHCVGNAFEADRAIIAHSAQLAIFDLGDNGFRGRIRSCAIEDCRCGQESGGTGENIATAWNACGMCQEFSLLVRSDRSEMQSLLSSVPMYLDEPPI
jgi:hypothetical protein